MAFNIYSYIVDCFCLKWVTCILFNIVLILCLRADEFFLLLNRYINFIWCHNHFSYGVHNAPKLTPDLIQYLLHCVLLIMFQKTNSSNVFFNSVGLFLTYALLCLFIINLEFFCVCFEIPLNVWFSHVDLLIFFFFSWKLHISKVDHYLKSCRE